MFGGVLTIIDEIKVKNIIIGRQFENSQNYKKFIDIVNSKKINVYVVESGQTVEIDKNLYLDMLWPSSKNVIDENNINNNSLVCKMVYRDFSVLFTGDIEESAENAILEKYKDTNILKSTILKVAHHGSKTSSTESFINAVSPQISLIGVGENNKFGHPNTEILERFEKIRK